MVSALYPLLIACTAPKHTGTPQEQDSAEACEDNPSDANDNGVTDDCERELLASFRTETILLGEPSEHVLAWLVCRNDAEIWIAVQPGLEATLENRGPFVADTATLDGWDAFRVCSAEVGGQRVGTEVTLLDYQLDAGGAGTAASIGTFEALVDDDVHELAMQVVVWEFFETEYKMEIAWYFFGAPGGR